MLLRSVQVLMICGHWNLHMSIRFTHLIFSIGLLAAATITSAQSVPDPTETVLLDSGQSTGELYILKADTNSVALHNPVLVVEGFDMNNTMNWPELYALINSENLVTDIQAFGRDLLVLNFDDSTAPILKNALLNITTIHYINSRRATSEDKFTAIGASLGGLTLRLALAYMSGHDVDTWVSFDAPHEGANIPLGLQKFLEYFGSVDRNEFDSTREYLALLDRTASKQMLIAHYSHSPDAPAGGDADGARQGFIDALNFYGYPTNCKTIAISNGSGYGTKLPFSAGELIVHWNYDGGGFTDPDIDADIYALPQTSAATVFHGEFDVLTAGINPETVTSYLPDSLDNAPGGTRRSLNDLFASLPDDYINGDDYCSYPTHCFVPTVSALGIPIENIASNLNANSELLALSPFDEVHTAITNEPHVQINARNKRWLLRAALEDIDTDGDGYDDYTEYLLGTAYNSPDSALHVIAVLEAPAVGGISSLSWNGFPNTQYDIWSTPALGDPWQPLDTVISTNTARITREYAAGTNSPSGFFKITAAPLDPVTD